jgi:uncharacterized protein (DUF983 family)
MPDKNSLFNSILMMHCPRCREGDMFPPDTLYSRGFMQMNKTCPCCGQPFEPEPGFYLGAMYTSYAIHGAIFLLLIMAFRDIWGSRNLFSLGIMFLVAVIALLPITFRLSRVIWIHIVVRYEGPCNKIPRR